MPKGDGNLQADINILRVFQSILASPITEPPRFHDVEEFRAKITADVLQPKQDRPSSAQTFQKEFD